MKNRIRPLPGLAAFACAAAFLLCTISGQAQQSVLTRHVREVTQNGQALSVGRLPATQTMRFDIVLPLRHEAELDTFLRDLYDPSSASYRHFLTRRNSPQGLVLASKILMRWFVTRKRMASPLWAALATEWTSR